ncbi:hypothetical protein ES703_103057 [subsurface metagenome]
MFRLHEELAGIIEFYKVTVLYQAQEVSVNMNKPSFKIRDVEGQVQAVHQEMKGGGGKTCGFLPLRFSQQINEALQPGYLL